MGPLGFQPCLPPRCPPLCCAEILMSFSWEMNVPYTLDQARASRSLVLLKAAAHAPPLGVGLAWLFAGSCRPAACSAHPGDSLPWVHPSCPHSLPPAGPRGVCEEGGWPVLGLAVRPTPWLECSAAVPPCNQLSTESSQVGRAPSLDSQQQWRRRRQQQKHLARPMQRARLLSCCRGCAPASPRGPPTGSNGGMTPATACTDALYSSCSRNITLRHPMRHRLPQCILGHQPSRTLYWLSASHLSQPAHLPLKRLSLPQHHTHLS